MRIVIENSEYQAVGFRVPVARMHTRSRSSAICTSARGKRSAERGVRLRGGACAADGAPREAIADALLDQTVLAGVGNVFKSEICFVNGLNPFRSGRHADARRGRGSHHVRAEAAQSQCAGGFRRHHRDLSRAAAAHHARVGPRREPVGLRARRRALPALRRADPPPHPRRGCARHLLVPAVPGDAGWIGCRRVKAKLAAVRRRNEETADKRNAEDELAGFIDKFTPEMARAIRAVRAAFANGCLRRMNSSMTTTISSCIGYSSTLRPSDCFTQLVADAHGVRLAFYCGSSSRSSGNPQGKWKPEPVHLLEKCTRFAVGLKWKR